MFRPVIIFLAMSQRALLNMLPKGYPEFIASVINSCQKLLRDESRWTKLVTYFVNFR